MAGPSFETVLDPDGPARDPQGDEVLALGVVNRDGHLQLDLRYRTDTLDAAAAARLAGYHLTALRQLVADPGAEPAEQSLLSAAEITLQLDGFAGPRRPLPDRRVHELIEDRVRRHPDRVAAVRDDQSWTYRELNARANRIAHALLARRLAPEDVVAIVAERDLDWMAAVLAVFKAGGAYLPIEPHFPSERIATVLRRAGCRFVLTAPGSTTTLAPALAELPSASALTIAQACGEARRDDDPGVPVAADQLAYIYFTSGSTGAPKGAMCEHAGMLNHLLAKIEDLEIAEGATVAQTAPQCFDISLWQLVSALLVGGRTVLVPQEVVLDAERLVEIVVDRGVEVLQVVPSYLEVVLSLLERRPRDLPDLRIVSVTGEALKKGLAQRWFATVPDIPLVNAYGLTETSDDTNHEVLHGVPDRDRIPLGLPVRNVRLSVVDKHLLPVPLGAPGLIAFSGVCVGRGYINDPERTRECYRTDPYRPAERLYLGGDYGRWLPDGKLEFLGRRDGQVKVRGFRIEIGEVESALLRVPDVRDAAVVVADEGRGARLVAFHTSDRPLGAELVRARLAESLPEYMVPAAVHRREALPLTANGKIDRKALRAVAAELAGSAADDDAGERPATPAEVRLAAAWSEILGVRVEEIGRRDDFFALGGTSLSAVKLAVVLQRAVSLVDITRNPVLADLARLFEGGAATERPDLLQPLVEGPDRARALVCFPHAGGNAVNFQPLARAVRHCGPAVLAVELPGHEQAAGREALVPLEAVAERVAEELVGRGLTEVLLWGQSAGTAYALATARRLEERGVRVVRLFLVSLLLGESVVRRADIDDVADAGGDEPTAAYRHDRAEARRWLAAARANPAAVRVAAPVTAVVADDDPHAAGFGQRYRDWELLTGPTDLHVIAGGGHHVLRTRLDEAARVVLRAALPTLPDTPCREEK